MAKQTHYIPRDQPKKRPGIHKKIKKYPKSASAIGGAIAWDMFDND